MVNIINGIFELKALKMRYNKLYMSDIHNMGGKHYM